MPDWNNIFTETGDKDMAKLPWNVFSSKYKAPIGYIAAVSANLPKGVCFDKSKKKLPTPYGLFQEWAAKVLTGDWATTKVPGGFIICVAAQADASLIDKQIGTVGVAKNTPACINTTQMCYQDSYYAALAKALGYSL